MFENLVIPENVGKPHIPIVDEAKKLLTLGHPLLDQSLDSHLVEGYERDSVISEKTNSKTRFYFMYFSSKISSNSKKLQEFILIHLPSL